jgi:hypothetical protein
LVAPTTWIDPPRFFRKPDFQLRDLGASAPDVSFSQNESSPAWRQPLIVTPPSLLTSALVNGSACGFGSAFRLDSAGGGVGAACAVASTCGVDSSAGERGDSTGRLLTAGVSGVRIRAAAAVVATSAVAAFVVSSGGAGGSVACDALVAHRTAAIVESVP